MNTPEPIATAHVQPVAQVAGSRPRGAALPYLLVAPLAIYLGIMIVLPVAVQAYFSFMSRELGDLGYQIVHRPTLQNYAQVFTRPDLIESLVFTMIIALVISIGTVVLSLPAAQFLARGRGWGKIFVELGLLLPLFGDIFLAYALIYAFAPQGVVNWALMGIGLIDQPLRLSHTPAAAVITLMLPSLTVLIIRSAFARVDPVYEEAALMMGAGPMRAWFSTTFALARNGVIGAFLLAFAGNVGAFTMPTILAGSNNIWMSTKIQQANGFNNIPLALALAMILTIVTAAVIYMYLRVTRRRSEAQRYVG